MAVTNTAILISDLCMLFVSAMLYQKAEADFDGVLVPVTAFPDNPGDLSFLNLQRHTVKNVFRPIGKADVFCGSAGRNIAEINTADLRDMESFMTQETHLFRDSIRSNLRIAKPDATVARKNTPYPQSSWWTACVTPTAPFFHPALPAGISV